jgi:hypothetical protein
MTYAPASLSALAVYWVGRGGVNLGVVGDPAHANRGVSYHLGKDQLTSTAYSRLTGRDKRGLTNGASAIDLGRLGGSYAGLRDFSIWLVDACRVNAKGTADMREVIYSPDGKVVLRWDRERGYTSAPRGGEADTSHLTHTHVSWYRDAEKRDHTTAFRPYFAPPPEDDEMPVAVSEHLDATIGLTNGVGLYDYPAGNLLRVVTVTDPKAVPGLFRSGTWVAIGIPSTTTKPARLVYVKRADVTVTRDDD